MKFCSTIILVLAFSPAGAQVLSVTLQSSTNVLCFGMSNGSASVTVSGGTTPYTYDWTPGNPTGDGTNAVSSLVAGTYSCTVTDFVGAVVTQTVTITEPPQLTLSVTSINATCGGYCDGSASVTPFGGTGPYYYDWTPSVGSGPNAANMCAGSYTCTVMDANGCMAMSTVTITSLPQLFISVTQFSNISCFGMCDGSATVVGSGGASPYSYSWSNGNTTTAVSGLCGGSCTATVTDANGCSTPITFTFNEPTQVIPFFASTPPSCNGSCDASLIDQTYGGTLPYSEVWSPAYPTCAGNYSCLVTDANGCDTLWALVLNDPPLLSSAASVVGTTCGQCNGIATVTPTGGNPAYNFSWTPNVSMSSTANNLCAGIYYCTVTDMNGCSDTSAIAISNSSGPVAVPTVINVTCNGACDGSIIENPSGGTPPYTYLWQPGNMTTPSISNLCAGCYTITVTDANGCTFNDVVCVTEPQVLLAFATSTPASTSSSNDGTLTGWVSGGSFPFNYSWQPGPYTGSSQSNVPPGTYTLTVCDSHNCCDTAVVTVGDLSGMIDQARLNSISIYPNPADQDINIHVTGSTQLFIYDAVGKLISGQQLKEGDNEIDASSLANGIYSFGFMVNGEMATKKVTVIH